MVRIGIILGSTRPNRLGDKVATWVYDSASRRGDAEYELVDLRDHPLPHLDEPPLARPVTGSEQAPIKAWSDTIASYDGYVLISPEYNFSAPGVLKNALDTLYTEWNNKAVGFVSYGGVGGARAVQHLRAICGAMQMADVAGQVTVSLHTEFENRAVLKPGDYNVVALATMLDQVVAWSTALAPLRTQPQERVA